MTRDMDLLLVENNYTLYMLTKETRPLFERERDWIGFAYHIFTEHLFEYYFFSFSITFRVGLPESPKMRCLKARLTVPCHVVSMVKRFPDLLSDVNFVHIWSEMMIAMGGFNTFTLKVGTRG